MSDPRTRRLAGLASTDDVDGLVELGCDLVDAGRQGDAEGCFRRAAELGSAIALFNLSNTLHALGRPTEAVTAHQAAIAVGGTDAWLSLGNVFVGLGDLAAGIAAYRAAAPAGNSNGALALAFELRKQGKRELAEQAAQEAAAAATAGGRRPRLLALGPHAGPGARTSSPCEPDHFSRRACRPCRLVVHHRTN